MSPANVRFGRIPRKGSTTLLGASVGLAIALTLGFLLTPTVLAHPNGSGWAVVPSEWENGLVLCIFSPAQPSVAVSAVSLNDSGFGAALGFLSEVAPSGSAVASAAFNAASWSEANTSVDGWFDMTYTSQVPIVPVGSSTPTGTVGARADFVLPAYASTPGQNLSAVAFTLSISGWGWVHANDALKAGISVWMPFPAEERINAPAPGSPILTTSSPASGRTLAYLESSNSASVGGSTTGVTAVSATPSIAANQSGGSLNITFGTSAGEFRTLNYTTHIGVVLPSSIAGIPTYEFVVVGGVGAFVVIALAATTRRLRRAPSDLEFVEEEP